MEKSVQYKIEMVDLVMYTMENFLPNPLMDTGHSVFRYQYKKVKPYLAEIEAYFEKQDTLINMIEKVLSIGMIKDSVKVRMIEGLIKEHKDE